MEGSKNAMYIQAGRSRGWSQSARPVSPAPSVPEPPVVFVPAQSAIEAPAAGLPDGMAQVATEQNTVSIHEPKPVYHEKDCETPVMAYIPVQNWSDLYEPEQGISRGTIFASLDLPWLGEGACRYE